MQSHICSLPRRQLRNYQKPSTINRGSSLPRRQLRKSTDCEIHCDVSSLPRRQLRKLFVSVLARADRSLPRDRKSTRLNSSHVASSYAVFCLKKNRRPNTLDERRTISEHHLS